MAINLNQPLAWKTATYEERRMLADLQANILKPHGRPDAIFILLRFKEGQEKEACDFIRSLSRQVTSALDQLHDTEDFKATGRTGRGILSILLSASGYRALGVPETKIPHTDGDLDTIPFFEGMKNRSLWDPGVGEWEGAYQDEIHAMIILADTGEVGGNNKQFSLACQEEARDNAWEKLTQWGNEIRAMMPDKDWVIHEERGRAWKNKAGQVVEHFGFADGISQIHMLQEDIEAEIAGGGLRAGSPIYWNPHFPLNQALVKDPGSPDDFGYGSYVVFRKLEQNVRKFREQELEIAKELGLPPEKADLVAGLICGRLRDGSPVGANGRLRGRAGFLNNFNYSGDEDGHRCPLHAHVRKINSRNYNEIDPGYREDVRDHLLVRRSMTYGDSFKPPTEVEDPRELPEDGVGVLFLAYQQSIRKQFEYIQSNWANLSNGSGPDPLIGQLSSRNDYKWPKKDGAVPLGFQSCVTLKGGEYFFAPSIRFLQHLESAGGSYGLQGLQMRDDQSMKEQINPSTRTITDETKPRKKILITVEESLQKIRTDPKEIKRFQKLAVAAIHKGKKSAEWRAYMEMLATNEADLQRLLALDGTDDDPEISTSRAYLVANGVCGSDTTMRTSFTTDNIDKDAGGGES